MPQAINRTRPGFADGQADFARKLMWRRDGLPRGITSHTSPQPVRRFNVYRNNVFHSLVDAVAARFPVVERLVGTEFFRAMAREFVERHPPQSPALFEYGGEFPGFLEAFEPVEQLAYLPDVARLEWARNVAYHAADAAPLTGDAFGALAPEAMGNAVLHLHPSAHLVASAYPIVTIWETNTHDAQARCIGPELPGEAALVVRPRLSVLVVRLGPGGDAFTAQIAAGATLGIAADCAAQASAEFSLAYTLAALIAAGALVSIAADPKTRHHGTFDAER